MTDLGAAFGKLAAFEIEIGGAVIMSRGEFDPVKSNLEYRTWRY